MTDKAQHSPRSALRLAMLAMVCVVATFAITPAHAEIGTGDESVSSPEVVLDIRQDNAAIGQLSSFGYDNFNPDTQVSDWGLMINGDSSTFRLNSTTGVTGLAFGSLTKSGQTISATGTFAVGGYTLTITREYTLVTDTGVSVKTTVTNVGTAISEIRLFDSFDPDIGKVRGSNNNTVNDRFTQSGLVIGQASDTTPDGYSVDLGVADPRAVIAAGNPFQINSVSSLNTAAAGYDGNGSVADEGLHIVFTDSLAAGATTSFIYMMGFGTSPSDGLSALLAMVTGCSVSSGNNSCSITAATNQMIAIDALAGTDTLALGGSSDFSFDVSKIGTTYANFEIFTKTGTSEVTLTGTAGDTLGFDIEDGSIKAGTGELGKFGANIIGANGSLIVGNLLEVGSIEGSGTIELRPEDEGVSAALTVGGNNLSTVFSGNIFGPGDLTKVGTGDLLLSGNNTYEGFTTILGGSLTVAGGNALPDDGDVIVDTGSLVLQSSETIGAITGAGTINLGSGTVLTTGGNNATSDYSGPITGAGGLRKDGTGIFVLTGPSDFSGTLDVAKGAVVIADGGSLANASVAVGSGAALLLGSGLLGQDGSGMTGSNLGAISAAGGSLLYLDDSTHVSASSLTLSSGSALGAFFTTDTTVHGQIAVNGTANIGGAQFLAYLDPASFLTASANNYQYTDVIKAGAVNGTFASVEIAQQPANGNFKADAVYKPDGSVEIDISGGCPGGGQPLGGIFCPGTKEYQELSGAQNAEAAFAGSHTGLYFDESIANRTNMARSAGCTVAGETWCFRKYAQGGPVISDVQGDPSAFDWLQTGLRDPGSTSVWGRIVGGWSQTDGDASAPGSNQIISGMVVGVDRVINNKLLLGLATQVTNTRINFRESPSDSTVTSIQLGGYFSYGGADAYLNGNLSISGSQADSTRRVFLGPQNLKIDASATSWFYAANLEVGKIYELAGFRLEPNASINATYSQGSRYTETGGGALDLMIDPDDSTSLRSSLGLRSSRVVRMNDRKIVPELRVSWQHEWLDRRQQFLAAFEGTNTFFQVKGQAFARDTINIGTGLTVPLAGIVTGYLDAQGAFSRDTRAALISVGARASW